MINEQFDNDTKESREESHSLVPLAVGVEMRLEAVSNPMVISARANTMVAKGTSTKKGNFLTLFAQDLGMNLQCVHAPKMEFMLEQKPLDEVRVNEEMQERKGFYEKVLKNELEEEEVHNVMSLRGNKKIFKILPQESFKFKLKQLSALQKWDIPEEEKRLYRLNEKLNAFEAEVNCKRAYWRIGVQLENFESEVLAPLKTWVEFVKITQCAKHREIIADLKNNFSDIDRKISLEEWNKKQSYSDALTKLESKVQAVIKRGNALRVTVPKCIEQRKEEESMRVRKKSCVPVRLLQIEQMALSQTISSLTNQSAQVIGSTLRSSILDRLQILFQNKPDALIDFSYLSLPSKATTIESDIRKMMGLIKKLEQDATKEKEAEAYYEKCKINYEASKEKAVQDPKPLLREMQNAYKKTAAGMQEKSTKESAQLEQKEFIERQTHSYVAYIECRDSQPLQLEPWIKEMEELLLMPIQDLDLFSIQDKMSTIGMVLELLSTRIKHNISILAYRKARLDGLSEDQRLNHVVKGFRKELESDKKAQEKLKHLSERAQKLKEKLHAFETQTTASLIKKHFLVLKKLKSKMPIEILTLRAESLKNAAKVYRGRFDRILREENDPELLKESLRDLKVVVKRELKTWEELTKEYQENYKAQGKELNSLKKSNDPVILYLIKPFDKDANDIGNFLCHQCYAEERPIFLNLEAELRKLLSQIEAELFKQMQLRGGNNYGSVEKNELNELSDFGCFDYDAMLNMSFEELGIEPKMFDSCGKAQIAAFKARLKRQSNEVDFLFLYDLKQMAQQDFGKAQLPALLSHQKEMEIDKVEYSKVKLEYMTKYTQSMLLSWKSFREMNAYEGMLDCHELRTSRKIVRRGRRDATQVMREEARRQIPALLK